MFAIVSIDLNFCFHRFSFELSRPRTNGELEAEAWVLHCSRQVHPINQSQTGARVIPICQIGRFDLVFSESCLYFDNIFLIFSFEFSDVLMTDRIGLKRQP